MPTANARAQHLRLNRRPAARTTNGPEDASAKWKNMNSAAMTRGNEVDEERAYYDLNKRVYPAFAPFYDLVALPVRRLRHQVVELVGAVDGKRVLDVATGTGSQSLAFAARGAEVAVIDISEAMLRVARRKNHFATLTFRRADATKLPFDRGIRRLGHVLRGPRDARDRP